MKKFVCVIMLITLVASLFVGCTKTSELDRASNHAPASQDKTGITDTNNESNKKNPADTADQKPADTADQKPADTADQKPVDTADQKPADTTEQKPADTTNQQPVGTTTQKSNENSEVIAGGKWDGGPVMWKITKDGVLTISGPRSVQSKESYIWKDYSDIITRVVIEDGIKSVPIDGFSDMTNITSVYLGSTVEVIGENAFARCTALESITISKGVKTICEFAFEGCTNLKTISFAEDCKLEEIKEYAFYASGLEEFNAPASLRTIDTNAFLNCESLQTVRLEGGVNHLGAKAFEGCTGLKHLVLGESITDIMGGVFRNCKAIATLEVYTSANYDWTGYAKITKLVIGGNRKKTGRYDGCTSLKDVTIGSGITEIISSAFRENKSLTQITLPDTVTFIKDSAFRESKLKKITIPARVTEIGAHAFYGTPLREIVFTGDAPSISVSAFTNVTATAYYPSNNTTWTQEVLQNYGGAITWIAQ